MTEYAKAIVACRRPYDFFRLTQEEQWAIDKELGILDWDGFDLAKARQHALVEFEHGPSGVCEGLYGMSCGQVLGVCDYLDEWMHEAMKSPLEHLADAADGDED